MSQALMTRRSFGALLSVGLVAGRRAPAQNEDAPRFAASADDFSRGSNGWLAGFSDYGLAQGGMQRAAELRALPPGLGSDEHGGESSQGFFLQGMNRSDDLFMFLKKPLGLADGIAPNAVYQLDFRIEFASNVPSGCVGVGGSPGDSVYLKAGGSPVEPVSLLGDDGLRLNVAKGRQSNSGPAASVVSDIANGLPCEPQNERWILLERRHRHPDPVMSSPSGELWILIGTDSAYEGLTQLYYSRIVVMLTRLNGGVS